MEKSPLALRLLKSSFNADLDGQAGIQELAGNAKKGLQKATWNLTKRVEPSQPGAAPGGGMRRGRMNLVDFGLYKVTLSVDGKDIATKTIKVSPDPLGN